MIALKKRIRGMNAGVIACARPSIFAGLSHRY